MTRILTITALYADLYQGLYALCGLGFGRWERAYVA